jgi:LysB family phage lysis regulatory protein
MTTLRAIAIAVVIIVIMALMLALQHSRVVALSGQVQIETQAKQEAVTANIESQATITTLRAEAVRNAAYQADLNNRLKASQQKALQARKEFELLKRTSKPVRDWADQPLPDGLRGKATSSDKDKRPAN